MGNLGSALLERFKRTNSAETLLSAVETIKQAPACGPESEYDSATISDNLGLALTLLWGRKRDIRDLNEAIEAHQMAASSRRKDHPDHANFLYNLGSSLRIRSETTWTMVSRGC